MTTCREIFTFSWPLRGRGSTQAVSLTAFFPFFFMTPLMPSINKMKKWYSKSSHFSKVYFCEVNSAFAFSQLCKFIYQVQRKICWTLRQEKSSTKEQNALRKLWTVSLLRFEINKCISQQFASGLQSTEQVKYDRKTPFWKYHHWRGYFGLHGKYVEHQVDRIVHFAESNPF